MTVAVIINPTSGRQTPGTNFGTAREAIAKRTMAAAGVDGEVLLTRARGHGAEIAAGLAGRVERVIAWGGDGTINEIAGPLIRSSSALGIVPAGSGDGLARGLGLRRDTETALRTALSAQAVAIDVGYLDGRHFLNMAGVGFDADVARTFNQRAKRGGLGYASIALSRVWSYPCAHCRLELDGGIDESGPKFLVAFANGREYGNGIVLSRDSNMHDGWLDAVVVDGGNPLQLFWRARRLFWRRNARASGMRRIRVKSGAITGETLVCHVDGETFEARGRVEVRLEAAALLVAGAK